MTDVQAQPAQEQAPAAQDQGKDLLHGDLGSAGKYDLAFKDDKLVIELDANLGASSAGVVLKIDAAQVCDALAKTGKLEAEIMGIVKAALLGK